MTVAALSGRSHTGSGHPASPAPRAVRLEFFCFSGRRLGLLHISLMKSQAERPVAGSLASQILAVPNEQPVHILVFF